MLVHGQYKKLLVWAGQLEPVAGTWRGGKHLVPASPQGLPLLLLFASLSQVLGSASSSRVLYGLPTAQVHFDLLSTSRDFT